MASSSLVLLHLRVPHDLRVRAERLLPGMVNLHGRATLSMVLRLALLTGLRVMEKELEVSDD